jgi:hypothetical protein
MWRSISHLDLDHPSIALTIEQPQFISIRFFSIKKHVSSSPCTFLLIDPDKILNRLLTLRCRFRRKEQKSHRACYLGPACPRALPSSSSRHCCSPILSRWSPCSILHLLSRVARLRRNTDIADAKSPAKQPIAYIHPVANASKRIPPYRCLH